MDDKPGKIGSTEMKINCFDDPELLRELAMKYLAAKYQE